jgi:hypothetical protein
VPFPDFYNDETVADARDKYEEYFNILTRRYDNPLKGWKNFRQEYFRLSRITLNLFSIFIIFAECEKVFSSVKILITDRRNNLKEDIIEAYILLKHWFKDAGLI